MTDIDDRVAAWLRDAASEGGRAVDRVALERVLDVGRGRATKHRLGRRAAGAVVLVAIVVLAFTIPLPRVLLHGGSNPSTTLPGGQHVPLPTVPVAQIEAGRWGYLPPAPIPPRTGAAEAWTGSELLVWGGGSGPDDSDLHDDGAAYNPSTHTWRRLPPSPLSARGGMAAVWTGSEMVVYGGYLSAIARPWRVAGDAAAYNPASNRWTTLPSPPLVPRAGALALWTGSEVVLLGGDPAKGAAYSDGAIFDPTTQKWSYIQGAVHPDAGLESNYAGALLWGHDVLAIAYETTLSPTDRLIGHVEVYAYDLQAGRWSTLHSRVVPGSTEVVWTGRYLLMQSETPAAPGAPVTGLAGCLSCGFSGSVHDDLLDPVTGVAAATQDPLGADDVDFSWTGDALLSFAGCACSGYRAGTSYLYDPSAGAWAPLDTAPSGCRLGEQPVWTGRQLVFYCPQNGDGAPAGLVYVPRAPLAQPSCFNHDTVNYLRVTDGNFGHGPWPLVGLYQFVVLTPELAALFGNPVAGGRATVFGDGKLVGYLPVPPPGDAGPPVDRNVAVVQFTSSYVPSQRYTVEVPFTGEWLGPLPSSMVHSYGGTTVDLCATVVISGSRTATAPTTSIAG